jgi:hypothetical protein
MFANILIIIAFAVLLGFAAWQTYRVAQVQRSGVEDRLNTYGRRRDDYAATMERIAGAAKVSRHLPMNKRLSQIVKSVSTEG